MFEDAKRILIIKLRHIGDVLLTVPTIRAVRERFPDSYMVALVNKGTEDMLAGNPLLNNLVCFDRNVLKLPLQKRIYSELAFVKKIREMNFDMTIDLTGGDRAAIISLLSGARYRIGYHLSGGFSGKRYIYTSLGILPSVQMHTVLRNLNLVNQFGMDSEDLSVYIHIPESDKDFVKDLFDRHGITETDTVVHIHPTSRWLFKCWKDEYMAEVIIWLVNKGVKVVVTSAPYKKEMDKAKRILSSVPELRTLNSKLIDLCGRVTLKQLAAISKLCNLFFGIDSAPMHIAAAFGTPVVVLFGPSGAFDWGPWDNNYRLEFGVRGSELKNPYQKRNGVQTFGKHTVIQRDWDCIPCGEDGCDGTKRSRCLEDIGVNEVMEQIEKVITQIQT
ncbi:MAG: putative lipopolysaccharide heptosyltransferase III [Nitrospirota bacterium]